MKTIGLVFVLAGFVLIWGIGYKGLTFAQLQADINSWIHGGGTVA